MDVPRMNFSVLDSAVIISYFVLLLAVGLWHLRQERTAVGYFLAGRTLTLPAFVATLVATWYGGILGVGEYSYQSGLAVWFVFGLPYYVFALVFALFLAERIRKSELVTIPDKIASAYGRPAGIIGGCYTYLMTCPAAYVLMQAVLLQLIFGLALAPAMLIGVVLSTIYVYAGGFKADVRVNIAQFLLMFIGFATILPYCFLHLGGFGWLRATLEAQGAHDCLTWHGGNSPQYVLVWFFIALQTLVDPGFHQRCYAAQDGRTARNGVLVSLLFWLLFDFMTTIAGMYARAALPGIDAKMSYPLLCERLMPSPVKGLFYVGMLATVMSTSVSYTFLSGVTFARDIVQRIRGGDENEGVALWTATGLLLTSILAISLALYMKSVVALWYSIGTVFVPGLLLPLMTSYSRHWRIRERLVPVAMLAASASSLAWLIYGQHHLGPDGAVYPLGLEPMYPGLLVSLAVFVVGWATTPRGTTET